MYASGGEESQKKSSGKNNFRINKAKQSQRNHIRANRTDQSKYQFQIDEKASWAIRPIETSDRLVGYSEKKAPRNGSKPQARFVRHPRANQRIPGRLLAKQLVPLEETVDVQKFKPIAKRAVDPIDQRQALMKSMKETAPAVKVAVRSSSVQASTGAGRHMPGRGVSMETNRIEFGRKNCVLEGLKRACKADSFRQEINDRNHITVVSGSGSGLGIYRYYICKYNNPALIKRCFSRRPWWKEMKEAQMKLCNLVWTQFPIPWVYTIPTMPFLMPHSNPLQPTDSSVQTPTTVRDPPKNLISQRAVVASRLPQNLEYGHKHLMTYSLRDHCLKMGKDINEIIPETYCISRQGDEEHLAFRKTVKREGTSSLWIIKPAAFTFGGAGIELARTLEESEEIISRKIHSFGSNQENTLILQRYISDPMLYKGRKFDIRAFCLITSVNGRIQAYFHKDGYARTSSRTFSTSNIFDLQVHLTNDCAQKTGDTYGKHEAGNKVMFDDLFECIANAEQSTLSQMWPLLKTGLASKLREAVVGQMKDLAKHLVQATSKKFDVQRKVPSFELVGLDFMITKELKVSLIEANNSPSLAHSENQALNRLLEDILEHTFEVAVDPLFPPIDSKHSSAISQNPRLSNRFELILEECLD